MYHCFCSFGRLPGGRARDTGRQSSEWVTRVTAVQGYTLLFGGGFLLLAGSTGAIITAAVRNQPGWRCPIGLGPWLGAAAVGMGVVAYFLIPVLLARG